MDPKGHFLERHRLDEARRSFLHCLMGENESIGAYLDRISRAYHEAQGSGLSDVQAVRHLTSQLPEEWAICTEETCRC